LQWFEITTKPDPSDKDIGEVMLGISNLLNAGDFQIFDDFLRDAEAEEMSIVMMINLLRTSFMGRKKLHNWVGFLHRAYDVVQIRGQDNADKVFRGLFK